MCSTGGPLKIGGSRGSSRKKRENWTNPTHTKSISNHEILDQGLTVPPAAISAISSLQVDLACACLHEALKRMDGCHWGGNNKNEKYENSLITWPCLPAPTLQISEEFAFCKQRAAPDLMVHSYSPNIRTSQYRMLRNLNSPFFISFQK